MTRPKCGVCKKAVIENCTALACDFECDGWYHIECVGISLEEHTRLVNSNQEWYCGICGLKNDKLLLTEELNNANKEIELLKNDVVEYRALYEDGKTKNAYLSEQCLKREEEIFQLRNELNLLVENRNMLDFPPLPTNNRFACLEQEDTDHPMSRSWTAGGEWIESRRPRRGRPSNASSQIARQSTPKRSSLNTDCQINLNRSFVDSTRFNSNSNVRLLPALTTNSQPFQHSPKSNNHINSRRSQSIPEVPVENTVPNQSNLPATDLPAVVINSVSTDTKPNLSCKSKRKVLVLSDSHGKDISLLLQSHLGNTFEVFNLCRPSAKMEQVLCDVEKYTEKMTKDDFIVLIAGSNNISPKCKPILSLYVEDKLTFLKNKSNLILVLPPTRHDRPYLNDEVAQCIKDITHDPITKDLTFVHTNSFDRHMFTKHGQHFNKKGKEVLSNRIGVCIVKQVVQTQSLFLAVS